MNSASDLLLDLFHSKTIDRTAIDLTAVEWTAAAEAAARAAEGGTGAAAALEETVAAE